MAASIAIKMSPQLEFALDFFHLNECGTYAWDDDISKSTVLISVQFPSRIWCNCAKCDYSEYIISSHHYLNDRWSQDTTHSLQVGIEEWSCNSIIPFRRKVSRIEIWASRCVSGMHYPYYSRTFAADMFIIACVGFNIQKQNMIASCFNGISIRLASEWWQRTLIKN